MSIPTQFAQRNKSSEIMEDCRDYLRTGRCKYGASCKYRHPPNVQSGGGMKGPLNPSEPLFPIRPNEPVCQYYMKHGTCKFGQACKFHHPASNNLHHASGPRFNQSVTIPRDGSELGGYDAAVMLPQRPEEPNCIYFLKNGRCKYGATCRYHHPLNYHNRRPHSNSGRHQYSGGNTMNDQGVGQPKLHYVSLPPGTYQQGQFVVADGQLAFLSLDGSTQGQVISVGTQGVNQEVPMVFTAATTSSSKQNTLSRDVGSSTSSTSIASSFESSMIGSGGSLNTFSVPDHQGGRAAHVVHSGGRQVIPQNQESLPQVVSTTGSLDGTGSNSNNNNVNSNNHGYFEQARRQTQSPARSEAGGSAAAYRGQRSASFDHSRPSRQHMASSAGIHESSSVPSFSYVVREEHQQQQQQGGRQSSGYQYDSQQHPQRGPQMMRGPPPTTSRGRQKRQSGAVDDGLSMMTSALLTMLDTPEEVAGEQYADFDEYPPSESSTPVIANRYPARVTPQHAQIPPSNNMNNNNNPNSNYSINAPLYVPQARKAYYDHEQDKSVGMPGYQYEGEDEGYGIPRGRSMEHMQRWSPSMQGSDQQQQQQTHPSNNQGIQIGPNQRAPSAAFEPRNNGSYFP